MGFLPGRARAVGIVAALAFLVLGIALSARSGGIGVHPAGQQLLELPGEPPV